MLSTPGMDRRHNGETMPDVTLDTLCETCGRPLRDHCVSRDRRLWYRPCAAKLRAQHPDQWGAETWLPDGEYCILCGWSVQAHYDWQPLTITVMGTVITPSDPCCQDVVRGWLGCGPTDD